MKAQEVAEFQGQRRSLIGFTSEMGYLVSFLPLTRSTRSAKGNMVPMWSFLLQRVRSKRTTATVRRNILVHGVAAPTKGVKARWWEKEKGSLDFEDGSSLEVKEVAMRERDLAEEEVVRLRNVVRRQRKELRSRMAEVEREESERKRMVDERANARSQIYHI
ncbi:hypothetical protein HPP92_028494 [Vanilla planifolia]|uniref:Uncharacterized protein n=2 Tax=Vanilla planifolia TaxID=51239 RepID=A0A835P7X8_VANPL|nr:hypothetical protein HPP92_028494 [Vanilla planifolia]